ncbi:Protein D1-like protein [Argiope bruennichi]|uniref:Protein D1-like protein n=1 Tax=Argiope bruennichi TaxID=94029 RepID=A0A8T0F083_ARGBR|nr:Protein D1-like protein [Argiope bruennichi]
MVLSERSPFAAKMIEYDGVPVTCGNLLSRKVTHDPPTVVEYKADKSKLYTLIMFDPDVTTPQNPDVADFRHWLVENIPGDDVKSGDMISPYFPTNPAPYSDAHRYTFVVYEQPEGKKLNDNFPNKPNKRTHFDLNKFIEDRNLQDPDAPTPQNPNLAIYRHWMFENVPGNIIQNGDLVTSYDAPQAPTFSVCFSRISAIEVDCDLNKFRTSNIVPKIIPTLPHSPLLVKFNNRAVACGNEFTRAETKLHPTVVDFDADIKKLYTFIMIDPDTTTPQYPDLANYLHWLIENVPGNVVLNGDSVTSYDPPQAPTFSGRVFTHTETVEDVCNFRSNGIVPDKVYSMPESVMKTKDPPTVVKYKSDPNKLYTLAMIDPDVFTPQNPTAAHYRHWLIENIPGDRVESGDVVSPYYPTAPPSYSDAHRYIFLAYEQPNGQRLNDSMPNESEKRMNFDPMQFIKDRNLQAGVERGVPAQVSYDETRNPVRV